MNPNQAIYGIGTIGVGVYLAAVFLHGNANQLLAELMKESGYLEFLVAAFILWHLLKWEPTRGVVGMFLFAFIVIALLNIVHGANVSIFTDYRDGKISLFALATELLKGHA